MRTVLIALTLMMITCLTAFVGCEEAVPTGPTVTITNGDGNVDVSVTTTEQDVGTGDATNTGGCCDGDDEELSCTSIPSGTPLPKESCIQYGGVHDCLCQ